MTGTIQPNGTILCDDWNTYYPDMLYGDTILLAATSWSRFKISDVVNKKVKFAINSLNKGYNYEIYDTQEN